MTIDRKQGMTLHLDFQCGNCGELLEAHMLNPSFIPDEDYNEEGVVDDISTGPRVIHETRHERGRVYIEPCQNCCAVDNSKSIYG